MRSSSSIPALFSLVAVLGCAPAKTPAEVAKDEVTELEEAVEKAAGELDDYMPLYGQRQRGSYEITSDIIGLGESRTRTVLSTGWGVSVTPWMPEGVPGMRFLNLNLMLHTGDYGDTQYDAFHIQVGHDPRFAVYEATAVEVQLGSRFRYTNTGAGQDEFSGPPVFVNKHRKFGERNSLSFGPTVGARLAEGALTIELFAEMAYALDRPFLGPFSDEGMHGLGTDWKPRGGVSVKTDLCFQYGYDGRACYYAPTAQENVDLGAVLRRALRTLQTSAAQRSALCKATKKGVALELQGPDDRCGGFEADGFFCRTQAALPAGELNDRLAMIRHAHVELGECTRNQRYSEKLASQKHRNRKIRLQYGAYAPEMRSDLACDPEAPPPSADDSEAELASVRRACELCPRACPAQSWWIPKD